MEFNQLTFMAALPEYILIFMALALVLIAAFARQTEPADMHNAVRFVRGLSLVSYAMAFFALLALQNNYQQDYIELFNGLFAINPFTIYMKGLVLIGAFFATWLVNDEWGDGIDRPEFHLLILLAVLGMLLMVSANDLIALYMGLELQSLPLYVVAAMRTNALKSSEAGLKYFLLGALSSGLLLYGCSFIYGFVGSTSFSEIATSINASSSFGLTVGMVFVLSGLAFKISAAPFHMWTPDVYEGAPTPVTAFFAIVPKVAVITLLLNITYFTFGYIADQWSQIIIALAVASMIVGATGAIMQQNIKRMLAYSSIAHIGYALVGLSVGTAEGVIAVMIYMTAYIFMGIAVFSIVMTLRRDGEPVERISDLAGLSTSHPLQATGMMIVMFSMAGIPPLAGFFGKWYVFLAAVNAGFILLAIIGVITSVMGAFYYLRIIKLMYFQEADIPLDQVQPRSNRFITIISISVILLFFLAISTILDKANQITSTLFI